MSRAHVHEALLLALTLSEAGTNIFFVKLVQKMGHVIQTTSCFRVQNACKPMVSMCLQRLVLQAWLSYLLQSDTSLCCQSWALDSPRLVRPLKLKQGSGTVSLTSLAQMLIV